MSIRVGSDGPRVPSDILKMGNFLEETLEGAECRPLRGNLGKGAFGDYNPINSYYILTLGA